MFDKINKNNYIKKKKKLLVTSKYIKRNYLSFNYKSILAKEFDDYICTPLRGNICG